MITLYTLPVPQDTLRDVYAHIKIGLHTTAIRDVHMSTDLTSKEAKDLCDAMRDGLAVGTYFVSIDTIDRITRLSPTQILEAIKELRDAVDLMPFERAQRVALHLTGRKDQQVVCEKWSFGADADEPERNASLQAPSTAAPTLAPSTPKPKPSRKKAPPGAAEPGTARRRLADELKAAWRRAGEPPLRRLEWSLRQEGVGTYTGVSPASISKAMSGVTGRPPSWPLLEGLLRRFGTDKGDIASFWRPLWVQAREEVSPLGLTSSTAGEASPNPAISLLVTPHEDGNPADGPAETRDDGTVPAGFECEDCGAWVVNADRHYAWHWNMEKQLRRALVRGVENTGS